MKKDKEPTIDQLFCDVDDPVLDIFDNIIVEHYPKVYSCNCGFFGYILSNCIQCPICKKSIKYDRNKKQFIIKEIIKRRGRPIKGEK
jgi:hypothetical protein